MITMIEIMRRNFFSSFEMLSKIIDTCSDELWLEGHGTSPFWQQIYHTLENIDYWFREEYRDIYDDADKVWRTNKKVTANLNENIIEYQDYLSKSELN